VCVIGATAEETDRASGGNVDATVDVAKLLTVGIALATEPDAGTPLLAVVATGATNSEAAPTTGATVPVAVLLTEVTSWDGDVATGALVCVTPVTTGDTDFATELLLAATVLLTELTSWDGDVVTGALVCVTPATTGETDFATELLLAATVLLTEFTSWDGDVATGALVCVTPVTTGDTDFATELVLADPDEVFASAPALAVVVTALLVTVCTTGATGLGAAMDESFGVTAAGVETTGVATF
jgi:hypothetical protein